jgi:hypothetical protein
MSVRFFTSKLPLHWTAERVQPDYGIDLRVELFDEESAHGLEFLVQLKASAKPSGGATEDIRLGVTTYNYLRDKLQIAMLVKYVESEDEAYWYWLSDIPSPNQDQDTFTVHLSRAKKVSSIRWQDVRDHILAVTRVKLGAREHMDKG